jgi:hypothetical protein
MPVVVGVLVAAYVIHLSVGSPTRQPVSWTLPAGAAFAFFLWTAVAAFREGPKGFWSEHTRNLWSNQIWFDLLLAAATALTFMAPRAREVGMRAVPWTLFVLATGSIGLLAMCARISYLEARLIPAGSGGAASTEKV